MRLCVKKIFGVYIYTHTVCMYVCMNGHHIQVITYSTSKDQPGNVVNPARGKGRFRPLKKFEKFGIFSKLSKLSNFPRSTMWKVESWKVWKTRPSLLLQPWYIVLSRLQQGKTRIGQLNLCRIKLPYRQRQQERASRVRRDHKLALRTAFAALFLVTTSVVSAAATI